MKLKISLIILFFIVFNSALFSDNDNNKSIFVPGEYCEYEVSFLGIGLGKITVETIKTEQLNGKTTYHAKVTMDTYSGIPFVDLHSVFKSWMDPSLGFSYQFVANNKVSDGWDYNKINFDYTNNKIINRHWLNDSLVSNQEVSFDKKINDGCSLYFFARQYTNLKKTVYVPTFIDGVFYTRLNFLGKIESVKINAIPYPVRTIYFDGKADWKGVYGMSGKFEGWFSDDDARIPIRAYMNVYVGKIKIELVKYKRDGWVPPKGN
jgi:archaellin